MPRLSLAPRSRGDLSVICFGLGKFMALPYLRVWPSSFFVCCKNRDPATYIDMRCIAILIFQSRYLTRVRLLKRHWQTDGEQKGSRSRVQSKRSITLINIHIIWMFDVLGLENPRLKLALCGPQCLKLRGWNFNNTSCRCAKADQIDEVFEEEPGAGSWKLIRNVDQLF